jgi:hypothetical protein
MKIPGYCVLFAVLVLILAMAAGCTTPQQAPAATQAPSSTAAQQTHAATAAPRAASGADIDTTVSITSNALVCVSVQDLLGTDYLYPDQKFKLEAATPGANTINANVLFVDENDHLKIREIKPRRDTIQNRWVYDGIVPLVQFNDITVPVDKSFTIKTQSKYYICADDRQEPYKNDNTYRVPVKLTRL